MGALQKIRSKSTLLVGVIAVGLLAFIVPWGEITQFLNVAKDKAFVVDGEVVKTRQYSERLQVKEDLEKSKTQNGQLDEMQLARVKEEVFQNMVTEILLQDQAERLGIAVTDAELNDMTHGMEMSPVLFDVPYFINPQTGEFSRAALNEFLNIVNDNSDDPQMQVAQEEYQRIWSYIENRMRYTRLEEKYASLVVGSVLVNELEAKSYFAESNGVADLAYISQNYNIVDDSAVEVSDVEIQDLYNIKKENFFSKYPSRSVTYLLKEVIPSDGDYLEIENQMEQVKAELQKTDRPALVVNQYSARQYLDAFIALDSITAPEVKNFLKTSSVGDIYGPVRGDRSYTMYQYVDRTVGPNSVKISMLPIQSFDPAQASFLADSLQTVLSKGKTFKALAQEMFPNMPQAGEPAWYTEVDLLGSGIGEQCFKASKGSVFKVDLNGMTALVKVEDLSQPEVKVKVADVTMPVIVSDKTNNSIDNEINKFISENKNPSEFAEAALGKGFNVITDALIYPNNPTLDNIPGTREIVRWAFNNGELDEIKKFETADARIVAVLTGETEEGYLPVSNKEVKNILKAELVKNKKADKITQDLIGKDQKTLASLATALDARVDTAKFVTFQTRSIGGVGYEPVLNVQAKLGKTDAMSSPLKGENGVYVVNVVERKTEPTEYNSEQIKYMLQREYSQLLAYSSTYMLMNKMDVLDNRVKVGF